MSDNEDDYSDGFDNNSPMKDAEVDSGKFTHLN
jgi:hypothetical protein